jgi:pantoate--beta-alanine ligase
LIAVGPMVVPSVALSPAERRAATVLYHALTAARERYNAGERAAEALRHVMHKTVSAEPLARLDYAEVVNADTMEPPAMVEAGALLVIAARIGTTRLIDSMALD